MTALQWAPVAPIPSAAWLPVFDDRWKAQCRACAHYAEGDIDRDGASMLCQALPPIKRFAGGDAAAVPRHLSCGAMRFEGAGCGEAAELFQARSEVT